MMRSTTGLRVVQERIRVRFSTSPILIPKPSCSKFNGSLTQNCTNHKPKRMCIGSSSPRELRILALTSGGTVIGKFPVGSFGAKSRMAKMMKLITNKVGMAINVRRKM